MIRREYPRPHLKADRSRALTPAASTSSCCPLGYDRYGNALACLQGPPTGGRSPRKERRQGRGVEETGTPGTGLGSPLRSRHVSPRSCSACRVGAGARSTLPQEVTMNIPRLLSLCSLPLLGVAPVAAQQTSAPPTPTPSTSRAVFM